MVDRSSFEKFMRPGGAGWFVELISRLGDIAHRPLIADELLVADLIVDGWPEFGEMTKAARLRWIRCAKIELDHSQAEHRVREIIEAYDGQDRDRVRLLLAAFPKDVVLNRELTTAEQQVWCDRAKFAAKGRLDEKHARRRAGKAPRSDFRCRWPCVWRHLFRGRR